MTWAGPRQSRFDCGDAIAATVRIEQTLSAAKVVNCAAFDFGDLWQRALQRLREIEDQFRCPHECPLVTRLIYWRSTCAPSAGGKFDLAFEAHATYLCSCDELPSLGPRAADPERDTLKGPHEEGNPQLPDNPGLTDAYYGGIVITERVGSRHMRAPYRLKCPSKGYVRFRYIAPVPTCKKLNFRRYVEAAKILAENYWDDITCPAGCFKTPDPFEVLRTEWNCVELPLGLIVPAGVGKIQVPGLVIVDVFFEVDCDP